MINVFIIDDHDIIIDGIKTALGKHNSTVNIVGSATNCAQALEKLKSLNVDIVLQDLLMPSVNGAECCRLIKELWPEIRVIALTGELNPVILHEAWAKGIDSIVLKGAGKEEIYKAINEVWNGRRMYSKGLPEFIFPVKKCVTEELPELTAREREVLMCLVENPNRKVVAGELFLSPRGLQFHITNLKAKFKQRNLKEVISKAIELRYIE